MWGSKRRAVLLWGVAGIPILAGTIQSVSALDAGPLEETYISQLPVIGGVAGRFLGIELFLQIGFEFVAAEAIVYILFFLIAAAWIAFGVTFIDEAPLRSVQRKNLRIAAIGLSGLVYAVLFYWVFRRIFLSGIPATQRLVFALVPVFVVGALGASWRVAPKVTGGWGSELEARLEEKRTVFETEFRRRLEPALDELESLPFDRSNIVAIRDARGSFEDDCAELEERIEGIQTDIAAGDEQLPEANQIESEIESLAPEDRVDELEDRLRDDLRAFYDERYAAFWERLESPYDEPYDKNIVNVPDYGTVHFSSAVAEHLEEGKLYIRNIDAVRTELLRRRVPVRTAVDAFRKLESHIHGNTGLIEHIRDREATFVELDDELRSTLEETERLIDGIGGELQHALRTEIVEGGSPDSARSLREDREKALEALHECLFDDAVSELEAAVEQADELYEALDTIRLAAEAARNDRAFVDLPLSFDKPRGVLTAERLEALRDPFVADTGRTFTVDRRANRLEFETVDDSVESAAVETVESGTTDTNDGTPDPVEIRNDVHYHLKRLRTAVRKDSDFVDVRDNGSVTMQTDAVDDMYKQDGVYEELDEFLSTQSTVENHTVQVDDGHGYIEITTVPDSDPNLCTQQLVDNYEHGFDDKP